MRQAGGLKTQERVSVGVQRQSAVELGLVDVAYEVQRLSDAKCPLVFLS